METFERELEDFDKFFKLRKLIEITARIDGNIVQRTLGLDYKLYKSPSRAEKKSKLETSAAIRRVSSSKSLDYLISNANVFKALKICSKYTKKNGDVSKFFERHKLITTTKTKDFEATDVTINHVRRSLYALCYLANSREYYKLFNNKSIRTKHPFKTLSFWKELSMETIAPLLSKILDSKSESSKLLISYNIQQLERALVYYLCEQVITIEEFFRIYDKYIPKFFQGRFNAYALEREAVAHYDFLKRTQGSRKFKGYYLNPDSIEELRSMDQKSYYRYKNSEYVVAMKKAVIENIANPRTRTQEVVRQSVKTVPAKKISEPSRELAIVNHGYIMMVQRKNNPDAPPIALGVRADCEDTAANKAIEKVRNMGARAGKINVIKLTEEVQVISVG